MVWRCSSAAGVNNFVFIDGVMDMYKYINILKENLHDSILNFYQDNNLKHKVYSTRQWFLYNCPNVIETPPQSPGINPIENLWAELKARMQKCDVKKCKPV